MVSKKVDVGEICGGARWVVVAHGLYPKIYCEIFFFIICAGSPTTLIGP